MNIETFVLGVNQTNCYLVWGESEGLVIDPGDDPKLLIDIVNARKIKLKYVINTHAHFDHIMGNNTLVSSTGAKLAINRLDVEMLSNAFYNLSAYFLSPFCSIKPDILLEDGSKLCVESEEFTVIHTPGHTPGASCIYFPERRVVFTGDTLFRFSYGRTDLFGGNAEDMLASLKKLLAILKDEDICLPGHGENFKFGEVRKWIEELV
ncbi:MAG: MBL fold metallo-hydrolase [Brevinematia bacterium]